MKRFLVIENLPFVVILASWISCILIIVGVPHQLGYDETLVTQISQQPWLQFIDTLQAEPHPPGMYILLRWLSGGSFRAQRIVVTSLGHFIVFLGWFVAKKHKLFKSDWFSLGVSLFLSMYSFKEIILSLKQDSLSFPLLFLLLILVLTVHHQGQFKLRSHLLILGVWICIFLLGYINALIGLVLIFTLFKTPQYPRTTSISVVFLSLLASSFWLLPQIQFNQDRFSWTNIEVNSFFYNLQQHLVGRAPQSFSTDLVLLIFLGLVGSGISLVAKKLTKNQAFLVFIFAIFGAFLLFKANIFIRPRYSIPLFFGLNLLAGIGLAQIKLLSRKLIVVGFMFVIGVTTATLTQYMHHRYSYQIATLIEELELKEKPVGIITHHPILPLVITLNNPNLDLEPINVLHPTLLSYERTITKKVLLSESSQQISSFEQARFLLSQTGLKNFVYLVYLGDAQLYDPKIYSIQVLEYYCLKHDNIMHKNVFLFYFSQCDF